MANNSIRVKQINTELVKTTLKSLPEGAGTISAIAKVTGLSVATCGNILNELVATGEVEEAEPEKPNGGRPARRFVYNTNFSYIACLYVKMEGGRNWLTYAVADSMGEVVEESTAEHASVTYEVIDEAVAGLIDRYARIKAVGIGIPGVVRRGVIGVCDFRELVHVPLGPRLSDKYGLEFAIENDMNAAVYGFYRNQQYEDHKTIAFVTCLKDNLPGAGIMVDGHILKGNTNFAGEVAFLPYDLPQEELLVQLNSSRHFMPLAVKMLRSLIAIINPETIALTGELFGPEQLGALHSACLKAIPAEHMPKLVWRADMHEDYRNGLISITLERLSYGLQLIEKRM
ncbi:MULTISPECIES: ROK family protein [unclassified Paenibacillus]|uniref:ROK family protein n=1 Tax=unclassified Paenibacillus TaxID=185978 RepID=UPI0009F8CB36|nr:MULTISPECIES: ROK family protein [unclassified Paenibacillus]